MRLAREDCNGRVDGVVVVGGAAAVGGVDADCVNIECDGGKNGRKEESGTKVGIGLTGPKLGGSC